jgi:hypothetical protein
LHIRRFIVFCLVNYIENMNIIIYISYLFWQCTEICFFLFPVNETNGEVAHCVIQLIIPNLGFIYDPGFSVRPNSFFISTPLLDYRTSNHKTSDLSQ